MHAVASVLQETFVPAAVIDPATGMSESAFWYWDRSVADILLYGCPLVVFGAALLFAVLGGCRRRWVLFWGLAALSTGVVIVYYVTPELDLAIHSAELRPKIFAELRGMVPTLLIFIGQSLLFEAFIGAAGYGLGCVLRKLFAGKPAKTAL